MDKKTAEQLEQFFPATEEDFISVDGDKMDAFVIKEIRAKRDVLCISEIINDLERVHKEDIGEFKFGALLRLWQVELMLKAGFSSVEDVRAYHAMVCGAENW